MLLLKYILFFVIELGIIIFWLIPVIKIKEKHEIMMATGALLFIFLYFESFGKLLGINYWAYESTLFGYIGIVVLLLAALIFIISSTTMRMLGKPKKGWEHTTQLIEKGIFSIIRHPIYFSSLLALLGVFMMKISIISIIILPIGTVCFFLSAKYEDQWNREKFGEIYDAYRQRTRMFIPFIY